MAVLNFLHSWVRWIVVAIAVIDLVYFALGWFQARAYDQRARRLMSIFSIAISIQWLIGLIYLLALGGVEGFATMPWGHVGVMTLGVLIANVPNMLRRRTLSDKQRYLANIITVIVVFALIGLGISLLPADVIHWGFYIPG